MATHIVHLECNQLLIGQKPDVFYENTMLATPYSQPVGKKRHLLLNSPFKPCASLPKFVTKRAELLLRNLLVFNISNRIQLGLKNCLQVEQMGSATD